MADNSALTATPQQGFQDFGLLTAPVAPPPMQQIPAMPGVGGMAQALMAIGQLPQIIAQGKYNQQQQQYQQQQQQLNAITMQARKADAAKKLYAQIGAQITSDTQLTDPNFLNQINQVAKLTGAPAPIKMVNGVAQIDREKLTPKQTFADLSYSDLSAVRTQVENAKPGPERDAMLADIRSKFGNVPESIEKLPYKMALAPGDAVSMRKDLSEMAQRFASGQSNYQEITGYLEANKDQLASANIDTAYYRSDAFINQGLTAVAKANVNKIYDEIGNADDARRLAQAIFEENQSEFRLNRGDKLTKEERDRLESNRRWQSTYNLDVQRVKNETTSVEISSARLAADLQKASFTNIDEFIKNVSSQESALRSIDTSINTMRQMVAEGARDGKPVPQEILDALDPSKPDSLISKQASLAATVQSNANRVSTISDNLFSAAVGQPVKKVNTGGGGAGGFNPPSNWVTGKSKSTGKTLYKDPSTGKLYDENGKEI